MTFHADEKTLAKFWEKVERGPGCWLWTGSHNQGGYGLFSWSGRMIGAHRFSMFLDRGTVYPSEIFACHDCDNPPCVNPDHLWPGTAKDNATDMIEKGRGIFGIEVGPAATTAPELPAVVVGFTEDEVIAAIDRRAITESTRKERIEKFLAECGL